MGVTWPISMSSWERDFAILSKARTSHLLRGVLAFFLGLAPGLTASADEAVRLDRWSDRERALIQSLSLESLGARPLDPSNVYSDNPGAAALGERIFFDPRFSANSEVSCSSCHQPDYGFTDAAELSIGIGTTHRRSMPLIGMAYQVWFAWDGGNDSLWSQALEPFEDPVEHGFSRAQVARLIATEYGQEYEHVFGALPPSEVFSIQDEHSEDDHDQITRVFVNVGKALAAYISDLPIEPTRSIFMRALCRERMPNTWTC